MLSKVVLAAAVYGMAGEGLIDLDRPVAGKFAFTDDAAKVPSSRSTILFEKVDGTPGKAETLRLPRGQRKRMAEGREPKLGCEWPLLYRGLSQQAQATLRRRECAGLRNW